MHELIKITALALSLLFCSSCEKNDATVQDMTCTKGIANHPKAAKYQKLMNKLLDLGVPGVSMTVISPEGTWSGTVGKADLGNRINLSPCHVLRLGSVSKVFCAATILKLQDEGKLDINDKVNKYVPGEIMNKLPNGGEVTIKHLLSHSSGIPEYNDLSNHLAIMNLSVVRRSAEENLATLYGKHADFEPGTKLYYSNSNYLLLALVIKYVSGRNANDVVYEKILHPLSLESTYTSTEMPSALSRGYVDEHDNGCVIDRTEIDNNAVGGQDMLDGGMIANSYDLAMFFNALVKGNILSASSLSQMETFSNITQDLGPDLAHLRQYGLGLMKLDTDQGTAIGHYGSVYCFSSLVYYFPAQDVTVAIARNGDSAKSKKFFMSKELFNYLF